MINRISKVFSQARTFEPELTTAPPPELPENSPETHFLRTWFEFDSGLAAPERRQKWGSLLGLVMVLGISGGFWTGVGLLIAHLLR